MNVLLCQQNGLVVKSEKWIRGLSMEGYADGEGGWVRLAVEQGQAVVSLGRLGNAGEAS